jgi:archaeosine synthase beta-subunit
VELFQDDWILERRPPRNPLTADRPYAYVVEREAAGAGRIVNVATLFLTNRECPFRCLMCDLWKNTLETSVAPGQIPEQIRWGLTQLGHRRSAIGGQSIAESRSPTADCRQPIAHLAQHIKLYNSGNFFDPLAIPPEDYGEIARLVDSFERVIVECHPKLIGRRCWEFRRLLQGRLEVAMGLETVHPEVLTRLNKRMTLDDFSSAVSALRLEGISVRAFILVRPPFLSDAEGLKWARRSLDYAFSIGVECCSLIPTRSGNGAMEELARRGLFAPPSLESLEKALEYGLSLQAGRVFLDLWDAKTLFPGKANADRLARLERMNLSQVVC